MTACPMEMGGVTGQNRQSAPRHVELACSTGTDTVVKKGNFSSTNNTCNMAEKYNGVCFTKIELLCLLREHCCVCLVCVNLQG